RRIHKGTKKCYKSQIHQELGNNKKGEQAGNHDFPPGLQSPLRCLEGCCRITDYSQGTKKAEGCKKTRFDNLSMAIAIKEKGSPLHKMLP
ncbi:MAG TPA: hypothetical protein DDY25_07605, partial [Peptococcaceae bacterium]|nr:hypothetical protein [Peptococcaceae bacterium]